MRPRKRPRGRAAGGAAKLVVCIVLIALMLLAGWIIIRAVTGVLNNADLSAGEPDPMFAATAEAFTRPPALDAESAQPTHQTLDDYVAEELSPVDKTAEQLAQEAAVQAAQSSADALTAGMPSTAAPNSNA